MPGFAEAAAFTEEIKSGDLILKTCPIEGLVMLKLISWDDRPHRTHDLTDIDNIIDAYFDWNSDEVFEIHHDIFNSYEDAEEAMWEKVISAHIICRKMKPLLVASPELFERVNTILKKKQNPRWEALIKGLNEA
jgi:predicted nucleotidyltransferase